MSRPLTDLADSQFITDRIELAAFFLANGQSVAGHGFDGKKVSFHFVKTPRLLELEAEFPNHTIIRNYNAAMETLWDIIRTHREGR